MSVKRNCPSCGSLYAPKGSASLCLSCSAIANVKIRLMMAMGRSPKEMVLTLKLTRRSVDNRRARIKSGKSEGQATAIAKPRSITIGTKVSKQSKPSNPGCPWPTGNLAREMHICCRVLEPGDIRCDDAA